MKIAMVQEKGKQLKNFEHLIIVDREEAALLIVMAEDYCKVHKQSKKTKKILSELTDNLSVF